MDCGLSLREIIQRVGRNQAIVMRIFHCWIQEVTMDQWGPSHPPRGTTPRDDWRIVCMVVMDRTAISRAIAQQIQYVTHHSVSALTIRRRLPFRMECPPSVHCFVYPCLETTGVCATNSALNGGHRQRKGTTLCLLTNPAYACNITMVGFEFEDTVERG
ncbi:uncharacterized protein TNCV_456301 [Trichonephila clavipes]|nr:uncharacterized protein TNCV_456301 [Trichonephila clavipes]